MNPPELHAAITAIANHLYCSLPRRDFNCLSIVLSELSKSMIALELFRNVCSAEKKDDPKPGDVKPPIPASPNPPSMITYNPKPQA
jgi:hypothetical protein